MKYTFTAVFVEGEEGWIVGYLEELPGAFGQGRTIEDAEGSLRGAAELVLQANRKFTAEPFKVARVLRRWTITIDDSPLRRRTRGEA